MTETSTTVRDFNARLAAAGLTLPPVPGPVGSYLPAKRIGNVVYTSGCVPLKDGELILSGKVGSDVTIEDASEAAELCVLNALAAVGTVVNLDNIVQVVRLTGYVASAPGFNGQSAVINGASGVLERLLGDAGLHARSAVGVAELPLNAPVEVELVVEVRLALSYLP